MQDQLIIYMALARGTSRFTCAEPTLHTRTAIAVASQLLPAARFSVSRLPRGGGGGGAEGEAPPQLYLVECIGAGVTA